MNEVRHDGSGPCAGMTRIRFKGFPRRVRWCLSPLPGHPLERLHTAVLASGCQAPARREAASARDKLHMGLRKTPLGGKEYRLAKAPAPKCSKQAPLLGSRYSHALGWRLRTVGLSRRRPGTARYGRSHKTRPACSEFPQATLCQRRRHSHSMLPDSRPPAEPSRRRSAR